VKVLALVSTVIACSASAAESLPVLTPPRASSYAAINCEGAPSQSVQTIKPPAAPYALIFCSPSGHAIAAVDGYIWFPINRPGQPFIFQAAKSGSSSGQHDAYFTNEGSLALEGEQKRKAVKMLEVGYKISQDFREVVQLDAQSNMGTLYSLFFYISEGRPQYVLGCVDRCNTSVLLKEYTLQEAKAVLQK
jgi:hypothetical protein